MSENKLEKLLLKIIKNSVKLEHNNTHSNDNKITYSGSDQYPMTKEEVLTIEHEGKFKSCFDFIPESLYNKQYQIGNDLKIYIQHNKKIEENKPSYNRESIGTLYLTASDTNTCNVVVEYHGYYYLIAQYFESFGFNFYHVLPTQTNWSWLTFTEEKAYAKREESVYRYLSYHESIKDIINLIEEDTDKIEISENIINCDDWNRYDGGGLMNLSKKEVDLKWYILQDTDFEGVFKPNDNFIEHILKVVQPKDKNLLKNLGINTVILRSKQHFDILKYFNINDIEVKAPKNIIKKYGLEKYSKDEKALQEIAFEKQVVKEKEEYFEYHNTFSLSQHGKIILKDKSKYEIQDYLEFHSVKYPFKNVKKITQTKEITKDVKDNLTVFVDSDCSNITFEELQSMIREQSWESEETKDSSYFYNTYSLETDKYILEVNGSRYIKDHLICDEDLENSITIKQLY